ncbi:MAG: hypothetical protein JWL71_3142 [Acidobacteria bacterium]|nr:hypothetical protein [Acidobacteriota bacterium]
MEQILHVLIVDRDRREGLATVRGSRWLLPIVCCTERMRAGPVVAGWAAERGVDGPVVGQWLGRLTPTNDAIDWLVIVDARAARRGGMPRDLQWVPLEHLKSSPSIADYQRWALEQAIPGEVPSIAGPFGSMTWFDEACDWLQMVAGPLSGSPVFYKITPHEVVLRVATAHGQSYLKGLTGDRLREAAVTSILSSELPESFAPTLALESRADGSAWWLTAHCSGTTVAADLTVERMRLVVAALGCIQQRVSDHAAAFPIPAVDLAMVSKWARALLRAHMSSATVDRCDAAIARAQRSVAAADFPCSWAPLDLDAGNVLIDDESVRFIDLDDSHIGAAPLPLATFLRRARRLRAGADWPSWVDALRHAYEASWTPQLALDTCWSDIETASILIDCHLGWQRLLQKIERGEVHGARELAGMRSAQRLAHALDSAHRSR